MGVNIIKGLGCRIAKTAILGPGKDRGRIILGEKARVCHGAILRACGGYIKIGKCSIVHYYNVIFGQGGVSIGNHVLFGPAVHIYAQNHGIKRDRLIMGQPNIPKSVKIGHGAWVGAQTVILAGSAIGEGTVIGAGSVVKGIIPPFEIWAGNPARKIGER